MKKKIRKPAMKDTKRLKLLVIRTGVRAGKRTYARTANHNETLVRDQGKRKSLKVKTNLKAGKKAAKKPAEVLLVG